MTIAKLRSLVHADFEAVNALIIDKIKAQSGLADDLGQHIIQSGGKRLRPLLVLLASHAAGYKGVEHIKLAATVEFFHTATLLHDDVVDDSKLRRGHATANQIWGNTASILVGDCLFTQSFQLLVDVEHHAILRLFADTAYQISCGEVKQLANRHNVSLSIDDYLDVIRGKTALLFATSAAIGALLTNAPKEIEHGLYTYGLHLGNAFQIIDDALDYCSDAETLGKNIGDDLAEGKLTLPLLYILKEGSAAQKKLIETAILKGALDQAEDILVAIEETKAIDYTRRYAQQEVDKALVALKCLPDSTYKEGLIELAQFICERNY
ncbi:MAG: polyprenyl synthetase family protein [Legionella sp.]|nr:polyprenyl synthetase family protein [Legionella sp.]